MTKIINYCGAKPAPGKRCHIGCCCVLTAGHKTPHRALCGLVWKNKGKAK